MGLDIAAFSHIVFVGEADKEYTGNDDDESDIFVYGDVLKTQNFLRPGVAAGLRSGPYTQKVGSRKTCFRAGTYSSYNEWRSELEDMAAHSSHPQAFSELVHFSDCEGYMGAAVCAKLERDFDALLDEACKKDNLFFAKYDMFLTAFRIAAQDGILVFC